MWPFKKKTPEPSPDDAELICVKMAGTCVSASARAYNVDLDYSPESPGRLEVVLQSMHDEHLATPLSEHAVHVRCLALGAYIGEVLRRAATGGTWARDSEFGADTFPLTLAGNNRVFPVSWAQKRVLNGPGENVEFKANAVLSIVQGKGPSNLGAFV
jgi:hypothetical protein